MTPIIHLRQTNKASWELWSHLLWGSVIHWALDSFSTSPYSSRNFYPSWVCDSTEHCTFRVWVSGYYHVSWSISYLHILSWSRIMQACKIVCVLSFPRFWVSTQKSSPHIYIMVPLSLAFLCLVLMFMFPFLSWLAYSSGSSNPVSSELSLHCAFPWHSVHSHV